MEESPTRSKPLIVLALLMLSMAATALAQAEGDENGTDLEKSTNLFKDESLGAGRLNMSAPEETGERYFEWLERNQTIILVVAALLTIIAHFCGFLKYIKNIVFHGSGSRKPEESKPPTDPPKSQLSDVSDTPGKISNVPPYLSFNFTGREKLLSDLRAALVSNGRVAIYGLGGIGKTQLALKYVDLHKSDYEIIWWVKSDEPTTLASDYAELAEKLNLLKREDADQKAIIEAVRNRLSQKRDWLLVFDNAEEPASVRNYLPQMDSGHVIITSRDSRDWKSAATPLEVTKFDRKAESIKFLLERTGQNDATAADRLADALGDLPLGLEQAGAYIRSTGESLSRYLELFQERQLEILEKFGPIGDEYPATVATTWDLSFQKASEDVPSSADLLNLCSFLAPNDIPKSLLPEGSKHLSEPLVSAVTDEMKLNDAVAALKRYSLMTVAEDSLSVHRLVQAVARDRMSKKGRKQWAEAAVRLVNEAFPLKSRDVRTWDKCSVLLPHAITAAGYAEELRISQKETVRLLNLAGNYLVGRAEINEAKALFERALPIAKKIYGPYHPDVALTLNNLGTALRYLDDLNGAEWHFRQALKIDEKVLGLNNFSVSVDVNNIGEILRLKANLAGAKKCFERALKIDEMVLGPNDPNVAIDVNNLGAVLQDLGDLAYAKKCFERALKIDEKVYGTDHPEVARDVNNLGGVLLALGDLAGAKEHYERALEIFRIHLGNDHPRTKTVRNNLKSLSR